MSRYILGTDGNIIDISPAPTDTSPVAQSKAAIKKINNQQSSPDQDFLNEVVKTPELSNPFGDDEVLDVFGLGSGPIFVTEATKVGENISSFGFLSSNDQLPDPEEYKSFNTYNVLDDENVDSSVIPFADESEIMAGFRQPSNFNVEEIKFIFEYITSAIVKIFAAELIVQANNAFQDKHLRFGEYTFTEYDIFTKYLRNIINYPVYRNNSYDDYVVAYFVDYVVAYFVGLSQYLFNDSIIDISKVLSDSKGGMMLNVLIDASISLLNESSLKTFALLIKKFNTQKDWVDNRLYTAKREDEVSKFFNATNYYHFKFIVERIHIGINIINRNVRSNEKTSIGTYTNSSNRVSGYRLNYKGKDLEGSNNIISFSKDSLTDSGSLPSLLKSISTQVAQPPDEAADQQVSAPAVQNLTQEQLRSAIREENLYQVRYEWGYGNRHLNKKDKILRKSRGLNNFNLPQVFVLNESFIQNNLLNNAYLGNKTDENGMSSMSALESGHEMMQNFAKTDFRRLPISLINEIEESLELEYVPFYFHDIRTNELISLHAFVENISDSYSPEYTTADGFGRIDSVRTYSKTTRSISMSFFVASMSPEDHDLMWYQINKLVSMCYPQWSRGIEINSKSKSIKNFSYPFSQVITNSPLIRIRLGDIITSNYSRKNVSRIFGINDKENLTKLRDGFTYQYYLKAGKYKVNEKTDLNLPAGVEALDKIGDYIVLNNDIIVDEFTYKSDGEKYPENADVTVKITMPVNILTQQKKSGNITGFLSDKTTNTVEIETSYNNIISKSSLKYSDDSRVVNEKIKNYKQFIRPDNLGDINNPIVASFEDGMSKGLAGHITNLDLSYQDSTWETSRIGSKAPLAVKISLQFAPIHDIPPGLDHNGMMRSVNYNVGATNNNMFGDPLDRESDYKKSILKVKQKEDVRLAAPAPSPTPPAPALVPTSQEPPTIPIEEPSATNLINPTFAD